MSSNKAWQRDRSSPHATEDGAEMRYDTVMRALKSYAAPEPWPHSIFLLPEDVIRDIYEFLIAHRARHCIELGTGFGATTCVLTAAMEELGGRVVTVDKHLHQLVNVNVLMQHAGLANTSTDVIVDPLGYNWYLADLLKRQTTANGECIPLFDFCLLDGAHEWEPDALAFQLVARLLNPGAWIVLDDINFNLRMIPGWESTPYAQYPPRALDAFQIEMVFDLVVRRHPDFGGFKVTHGGRIGWAQKLASRRRWRFF